MTAHIINLKHRTDRWDTFQDNWKKTNLMYVREDAILSDKPYEAVFTKHLELLREAKAQGETYLLVMEDDAMPCAKFDERWAQVKEWLETQDDWDIFNGGMLSIQDCIDKITRLRGDITTLVVRAYQGCMAHFVYYHIDRALEKISVWEAEGKPDFDCWYPEVLNVMAGFPYLSTQGDGFSDAVGEQRVWSDRFKYEEHRMLYALRDFS